MGAWGTKGKVCLFREYLGILYAEIQGAPEVEQLQDPDVSGYCNLQDFWGTYKCNGGRCEGYVSSPIAQLSDMHTMLRMPYVHPRAKLQCRTISAPFARVTLMYDSGST